MVQKESQDFRSWNANLILQANVTSFQTCPRLLIKKYKFEGKISVLIKLYSKIFNKNLKFGGQTDIEIQGHHQFLNSSETFS